MVITAFVAGVVSFLVITTFPPTCQSPVQGLCAADTSAPRGVPVQAAQSQARVVYRFYQEPRALWHKIPALDSRPRSPFALLCAAPLFPCSQPLFRTERFL